MTASRIIMAFLVATLVCACSGPLFYRDVIIPTDPNHHPAPAAQGQP